jgi:hypothetical protein
MKNIILFIITAIARAIASLLGLRSWAKAKKADVNLYLTEEDYSFMRMFPGRTALERYMDGLFEDHPMAREKTEVWSPSGSETTRTESDWHPPVGYYSKVHVPRPAGSGVMTSANISPENKLAGQAKWWGFSDPVFRSGGKEKVRSRRRLRHILNREVDAHISEEVDAWTRKLDVSELVHHLKAGHKELLKEGIFRVAVATEGHFSSEVTPYPYEKHPDFDGCLDTAC